MRVLRPHTRVSFGMMTCVIALGLCQCDNADAFFWPPWPGSDGGMTIGNPDRPGLETGVTEPPPTVLPSHPEEPPTPSVPEPATLVTGLIGLGMLAGYRRWKKTSHAPI